MAKGTLVVEMERVQRLAREMPECKKAMEILFPEAFNPCFACGTLFKRRGVVNPTRKDFFILAHTGTPREYAVINLETGYNHDTTWRSFRRVGYLKTIEIPALFLEQNNLEPVVSLKDFLKDFLIGEIVNEKKEV